ncbi:M14 family metallopeptidase [Tundrisphaera lichenicola]|uniref:M14 family metallopeptidase n=1 Tax=Tundrisphaera lichenicola TaxID=2029860 RepID=UPI003EBCC776
MRTTTRLAGALSFALMGFVPSLGAEVPSPESHLGFQPGADFRLANWPSVVEYFRRVDSASDRVEVRELGKTTEGRPYLVAIVSNPETIRDIGRFQGLQKRLARPTEEDAQSVVEAKPVVLITCSIHSSETASTHMAMELLHELASGDDPGTREILDNAILLLVPSANPDGVDKVAAWYERTKGHPWEGEGMPELYHKYAGHDTNRDWFMLNLQETRLLTRFLYQEFPPTLAYDVHQMGPRGARMFVPPFFDPVNPNLDARLNQGIFLIGAHMAADLAAAGKTGVLTHAMYDNWWNGGMRTTPQRHNVVAVLTEAASVKMASPIFLDRAQLSGATRGFANHDPAVNFVEPWPGGWWRLRDIVEYQQICARSILTLASRYRRAFQENYRRMGLEAIRKGREEPPFGWVVPADQRDPGSASKMLSILHDSGIQIARASRPFFADGVTYPAGSWLLPADQPYRAHLKDMMERQEYPNRLGPNGAAEPPYDVAGWTLPLQMGVRVVALGTPVSGEFDLLDRIEPPRGTVVGLENPKSLVISNRSNDDFRVLNALLEAGVEVRRQFGPGRPPENGAGTVTCSLAFSPSPEARVVLDRVLPNVSTQVEGREGKPTGSVIEKPSVALYQPWVPSMDEGWTRLVLEQFDFPYRTVHDADIRSGNLAQRFRTILIPSIPDRVLLDGYRPGSSEPAYVGGLGPEGIGAIREFVRDGGTLVCLEDSCRFAIEELGLPVVEVTKNLRSSEFYAPGSILRAEVRPPSGPAESSLTVGVPEELSIYFDRSMAFEASPSIVGQPTWVWATYAKGNPLESGWLLGPEKIQGKAALVEVGFGKGRVVLFGFPPQHRGQPHGTFRLLFNSLRR